MMRAETKNDNSGGVSQPLRSIILAGGPDPLHPKNTSGPSEFNSEGPITCGILSQPI